MGTPCSQSVIIAWWGEPLKVPILDSSPQNGRNSILFLCNWVTVYASRHTLVSEYAPIPKPSGYLAARYLFRLSYFGLFIPNKADSEVERFSNTLTSTSTRCLPLSRHLTGSLYIRCTRYFPSLDRNVATPDSLSPQTFSCNNYDRSTQLPLHDAYEDCLMMEASAWVDSDALVFGSGAPSRSRGGRRPRDRCLPCKL